MTLRDIQRRGRQYTDTGFRLDLQLKSAAGKSVVITDTELSYDLAVKAYDDLRGGAACRPRILVLVVFPGDESLWTTQTEEHLMICSCAYWLSLEGRPATTNKRTVRLAIPRNNLFSVEGVNGLMERVRREESL